MKKVVVALVILAAILAGCTGGGLAPAERATLQDLYNSSMGLYVHWKVSVFLAAYHRADGAASTHIEMPVSSTRKRADFVAVYDERRGPVAYAYEIKPHYRRDLSRVNEANAQLADYLTRIRNLGRYVAARPGRRWVAEPTPVTLPDEYVPELASRCMEVRLRTYENLSPGVIYYWFVQKDTDSCRRRTDDQISNHIIYAMHEVSNLVIPRNYRVDYARWRVAQVAADEHADSLADTFYLPFTSGQDPAQDDPPAPSGRMDRVFNGLMGRAIPMWMRSNPVPWQVPIPGMNNGQTWECNQAC